MIHYIIVKWNDKVDKQDLSKKVKELFSDAVNVSGVSKVEIKDNVTPRDNRYDIMIAIHMNSDALCTWDNSELHKKWKAEYGNMIEKKCIFDCE